MSNKILRGNTYGKIKHFTVIMLSIFLLALLLVGCDEIDESGGSQSIVKVSTPMSGKEAKKKSYEDVETKFRNAGFTNISLEVLDDLVTGWLTKDGSVESVEINGLDDFIEGAKYDPGTKVIITYHTFPDKEKDKEAENVDTESQDSISESTETFEMASEEVLENVEKTTEVKREVAYTNLSKEETKEGNSGIYTYIRDGKNYDQYVVIDIDGGYVYSFMQGNDDEICTKGKITEGDLNSQLIVKYVDGDSIFYECYCFSFVRRPDKLMYQLMHSDGRVDDPVYYQ